MKQMLLLAGCLVLIGAQHANAQTPHVLGVWEFNIEASELFDGFPLQSDTRVYSLRDDGYLVALSIRVDRDGNPNFIQAVARSDGEDYPEYRSETLAELQIDGTTSSFTYAETVVDEYTVDVVAKRDGQEYTRATRTVSGDGQTMTLDVIATGADGQELPFSMVFDRQQ